MFKHMRIFILMALLSLLLTSCVMPNIGKMFFGPNVQGWNFEGDYGYFIAWDVEEDGSLSVYTAERCPTPDGYEIKNTQRIATGVTLEKLSVEYLFTSAELKEYPETIIVYTRGLTDDSNVVQICQDQVSDNLGENWKELFQKFLIEMELIPEK